jgi:rRNA small subunit pseudouridine methyltransferase Nep1
MLRVIFVETALELVPKGLINHPSVRRNARKKGKRPEETLLNRSLHHYAMVGKPGMEKRGRPDIIQICLLEALGSPLNRRGKLATWIHTVRDRMIEVNSSVRLPRDCNRFNNLMEQLLVEGQIPPKGEKTFLRDVNSSLSQVKKEIDPTLTIALTSHGEPEKLEDLCIRLSQEAKPLVFLGAYPRGPMDEDILSQTDKSVSIYPEALEAWVVTSRIIYEYEKLVI